MRFSLKSKKLKNEVIFTKWGPANLQSLTNSTTYQNSFPGTFLVAKLYYFENLAKTQRKTKRQKKKKKKKKTVKKKLKEKQKNCRKGLKTFKKALHQLRVSFPSTRELFPPVKFFSYQALKEKFFVESCTQDSFYEVYFVFTFEPSTTFFRGKYLDTCLLNPKLEVGAQAGQTNQPLIGRALTIITFNKEKRELFVKRVSDK